MTVEQLSILAAALAVAFGAIGPALGEGRAVAAAMDAIARQPEAAGTSSRTLFVGLAMIETMAIYCFVIACSSCSPTPSSVEAMRIDWWTLALQAANFLVLVWLLQHFLYRPVLGIIAERQQRTDGVIAEANAAKAAAEGLRAEVKQQRGAIAKERAQALEQAHARAKQDAATLLERARADAEKLLAEERQRIEHERAEAVEALRRTAIELAGTIARRLLADATEASLDGRLLDRAIARCAGFHRRQGTGPGGPAW